MGLKPLAEHNAKMMTRVMRGLGAESVPGIRVESLAKKCGIALGFRERKKLLKKSVLVISLVMIVIDLSLPSEDCHLSKSPCSKPFSRGPGLQNPPKTIRRGSRNERLPLVLFSPLSQRRRPKITLIRIGGGSKKHEMLKKSLFDSLRSFAFHGAFFVQSSGSENWREISITMQR